MSCCSFSFSPAVGYLILSFNSYHSTKSSSWIGRVISSKLPYYPSQSTDSMQSLSNYQRHFFTELEQKNLKIWVGTQKAMNSQSKLEKEKWGWRNQASWPQTILQPAGIKTILCWHKSRNFRSMEQDRKPRNKPMSLWSMNLTKERSLHNVGKKVSWTNGAGKNEQLHVKNEIRPFFNSVVKISSKWIKDLNISVDTIKLGNHRQDSLWHKS